MLDNEQNLDGGEESHSGDFSDETHGDETRTGHLRSASASRPLVRPLSRGQKLSVVVLAFFSIFIIFLWFAQFKKNLSGVNNYPSVNNTSGLSGDSYENDLMTKDTDGDGLSDYDELNIYKTSPYLEDSDSDGFTDKSEVDSGYDPNCPEGRDCYGADLLDNNYIEDDNSNVDDISGLLDQINSNLTAPVENNQGNLDDILSGNTDAATLRQALVSAGMDKNVLDQFSDEELLGAYKEILGE